MSLLSFVRTKDIVERIKPFRTKARKVDARLLVPPGAGSPQLVGTAFDYLLRFELHRRAPHAVEGVWVAEHVPNLLWCTDANSGAGIGLDLLFGKEGVSYMDPKQASDRTRAVCAGARAALADYLKLKTPDTETRHALAAWSIRLAKVENIYRSHVLDTTFEVAPVELVNDLVALLEVVPFDQMVHPGVMFLNPMFGAASLAVGGADADLIAGDLLVDIKTTKTTEVKGDHLDQLFGYFLLTRRAGLPALNRVGLYFSRFGHLWTMPTVEWTQRPEFAEVETWFFTRAGEMFGSPQTTEAGSTTHTAPGS